MSEIDVEWESFMGGNNINTKAQDLCETSEMPEPSDIYISTKSKIGFLNTPVDIKDIFWKIPVLSYWRPAEGIVKKQVKLVSADAEELEETLELVKAYECVDQQIITHIDNPEGRIKFKDIRKVSIGISKKDILTYHSKKKSAFYNCFVIIMRIKYEDVFREIHIKVFNTGKQEIPGIQNDEMYELVLDKLVILLKPLMEATELACSKISDTILINSNFTVGFYINREVLYRLLKDKYNIECIYDPCSYPGIQCKYYYLETLANCEDDDVIRTMTGQNVGVDKLVCVSFMIFRTGSVLIVGKCNEKILRHIYSFLKTVFREEYTNILQNDVVVVKEKTKKVRRKIICVNN